MIYDASRTGAVISRRSIASSIRWTRKWRRSAAVSFDHAPETCPTGVFSISAAIALDFRLISQLSLLLQAVQNNPAEARLKNARSGFSGSSSHAPQERQ